MSKFCIWFGLIMKKTIKNKFLLLLFCLIPVCAIFLSSAGKAAESEIMKVGIYTYGNDELSITLASALDKYNGSVDFVKYSNKEQLYDDVSNERLECGYVLPDNLTELTDQDKFSHCIDLIKSPSTMMFEAINEIIFSQLIRIQGGMIIENYINNSGLPIADNKEALDLLQNKYNHYLDSEDTFHVDFYNYEDNGLVKAEDTGTTTVFPLRGVIAIVIFIAGLFASVIYLSDREKEIFLPMSRSFGRASLILYPACALLLFSVSGLIAVLYNNNHGSVMYETFSMIVYMLICLVFCILITLVCRNSKILTACIPALALMSLLICPVFVNTGAILPFATVIEKLLPPFYYLKM